MLDSLTKTKASRVIGIDCSTNSIAFAVFEDKEPVQCGEVELEGDTVFNRLSDAGRKTKALVDSGVLVGDYIAMEEAIYTNNMQTAIKLAMVYGAVLRELMVKSPVVVGKAPISWQTTIGNPNLKKHEKEAIMKEFPGKSKSWYKEKGRQIRKQRTLDIAKQYFKIEDDSDNVGDAVGIALAVIKTEIQ